MPNFSYTARTREGKKEIGTSNAISKDALAQRLQERGLIVTKIVSVEKTRGKMMGFDVGKEAPKKFTHSGVKLYDLVFFARQLAILVDSGVTIHRSLDALLKQVDSVKLHKIILQAKKDIEAGLTLKDALAKYPKVFSELWINIIESGEASGNLALVLDRLAKYMEMRAEFNRKITSALIYPVILFAVALCAIIFFVVKIVPTFAELFKGLGAELPALTKALVNISNGVKDNFFIGIALIIGLYFAFKTFVKTSQGRYIFDVFKIKLPLFGDFFKVMAVERFTSEMATLIEGGVPILYALEITERSSGNKILQAIIRDVKVNVREGQSLAALLGKNSFFEPMVIQMISIGEEVGELAKMFRRVANFYEEYVQTFIGRFATIFEPIMLVFMGGVIGTMLIALFLPIFSIATLGGKAAGF
ncbi:MAG: hypothetical protein COV72_07075 [Candidatus Omnitrophica bacterium CG11_big_fil_rev_8_21_14_0_20_42_13]|uniref:Type II secretion system protein GspF domain-containing protein n=1 Tax=Candidatus Ghiorseimicrobium undicola TaxID=1974746 RepID=A0A2H0LW84_9BACT|nr:MAG: hypothetical protein COV72_07075 [Candidatus Omnitrophica bacterium CG11_big_fil_rev_8_21_14_0_20_42_13]